MAIHERLDEHGVAEVVMDSPPVNALTIADTYRIAEIFDSYRSNADVRCAVLTATGRGFNAGVDIKELQRLPGNEGIVACNDACYQAFRAVYQCAVPVIAAVQDFCLGLGIGLAGNSRIQAHCELGSAGTEGNDCKADD